MPETCAFPNCNRIAQKNSLLCIGHRIYENEFPAAIIKEEIKQVKKPIKKVSDKRTVLNRELAKIVKEVKNERPVCELKVSGICSHKTVTVHHTKGRIGELLLNKKYMKASCSPCNLWVESHTAEAKEMGLIVSRHKV